MTDEIGESDRREAYQRQADEPSETEGDADTGSKDSASSGRTRDLSKYPMYLPDGLREELNETYELHNARRTLDGKPQLEKHRHFLTAVVRTGLEADWKDRIED